MMALKALAKAQPKLVTEAYWNATASEDAPFSATGFEQVSSFYLHSSKMRQAQFIDLSSTIAQGLGRIWASEGEDCIMTLNKCIPALEDPNALFLFDEVDGHLDYYHKTLFFEYILPRIKGTALVVTHDPYFLADLSVLDLTDSTHKTGIKYYDEQRERIKLQKKTQATPK